MSFDWFLRPTPPVHERELYVGAFLNGRDAWPSWWFECRTKLEFAGMWEYCNPDKDDKPAFEEFLQKPKAELPKYSDFKKKPADPQAQPSESQDQSAATNEAAASLSDMSEEDQLEYQSRDFYVRLVWKEYRKREKAALGMREWFRESVSGYLFRTSCLSHTDIPDWIISLQARVATPVDERIAKTIRKLFDLYIRAENKEVTTKTAFVSWYHEWHEQMLFLQALKPEEFERSAWIYSFTAALSHTPLREWAKSYLTSYRCEIEERKVDFKAIVRLIEYEILSYSRENVSKETHQKGRKRTRRRKRDENPCRACGMSGHAHVTCFYLQPSKAPKSWERHAGTQFLIIERVKTDKVLSSFVSTLDQCPPIYR